MTEHPIHLTLEGDLRRSRLMVFFRILLLVPHVVWIELWSIPAYIAVCLNWFVTLARGRPADPLHRFVGSYLRYLTHVGAFLAIVGNPFPGFLGKPGTYPVDLTIAGVMPQHRLKTLFRIFLVLPGLLIDAVLRYAVFAIAFLGWWVALVTGRMPRGFVELGAFALRYNAQTMGYLVLLTDRYPYSGPSDAVLADAPEPPPAAEAAAAA